jgi:hypothetical protein
MPKKSKTVERNERIATASDAITWAPQDQNKLVVSAGISEVQRRLDIARL